VAVLEWVRRLLVRVFLAVDHSMRILQRAWGIEMEVQMEMTVKQAEIMGMGSE
jgi:hypothetical protein